MTTALHDLIIERIRSEGPLTFAEYMRMALYEPGYGYYVTGPARTGWEGDYYTSSDVSPFFAHCMARQLVQFWNLLKRPAPFTVLEQGAGRGSMAQEIRAWAAQHDQDFHAALDYRAEDIRQGQDALSQEREALHPSVLVSNELVDAFPVHIVEVRERRLYEVYIGEEQGHLLELLAEPSSSDVAHYLDSWKIPWPTFPDGWRAEVNLEALRWMQQSAALLTASSGQHKRHGFLLTIDYGDKARALYSLHRPRGTLACYFQHQLTERPLVRPGEQDITTHVNFSALIDEGRRQGLHLHAFTTQRVWLEQMGIYDELARMRQQEFAIVDSARASDQGQIALLQWYDVRNRVTALTDPAGMGNFKVLIMKR
jgi:SAM-dependent MidA family methyltransferase